VVIVSRKSSCFFEVEFEGYINPDFRYIAKDIYVTELGNIMISVYNVDESKTVNYFCGKIWNILPDGIKIKEGVNPQFFLP
jgi:hypothetical protein